MRRGDAVLLPPLPLDDVQVCAAEASPTHSHNDVMGTGDRWLGYLVDHRTLVISVQADSFHGDASMSSSSGPTNRDPGSPQARKKSPVVRHSSTLMAWPDRMRAAFRRRARATLALVAAEPSPCTSSGASRPMGWPAVARRVTSASSTCRA